ncbi:MAG: cyclodeaminase/cyclohydrolase family protein [Candidatus Limnocylindrales bacterium]
MPSGPVSAKPARFADLTVAGFVEALASSEPVPGGGSASAVAASLAAGLVAMVAALSEGRPKYAHHAATHASAGAAGRELAQRLLRLADDDAAAYAVFAAALRMPKETDNEQAALRSAARTASEVPLACVEACREVVEAAHALAGRCNMNASSDLAVATLLATAAAHGAGANVLVNLPAVGDSDFSSMMSARVGELLGEIDELSLTTRSVVASGELRAPLAGGA